MADLHPSPFRDLVARMFLEPAKQQSIFDLPLKKCYRPDPTLDTSVKFHGQLAATPVGPAAGPQTQMAQNLVLCWLGGSRILELKTVQIDDQLVINRPCIDMANVGYNIEFSQELRLQESIHEYVAGMMLIEILKADDLLAMPANKTATIYDFSLGYDLKGISSPAIRNFIATLRNAKPVIDKLRQEIPDRWKKYRALPYPTEISRSITLSTFHNCPPDQIEKICDFLLTEIGMDVVVKMNPTMHGPEALSHLLHDRLGYSDIRVNEKAFTAGLAFDDSLQMMRRLQATGKKLGLGVGVKFSNTLEVVNHKTLFPKDQVMYMSGLPLHVITLSLVEKWKQAYGAEIPISFSAGIDKHNFANAVACGFVPVTTCSDLLKVGGYGRLFEYLKNLEADMKKLGVANIPDYIAKREGLSEIVKKTVADERYTYEKNKAVPKRIDSKLWIYDCISCDKCVPVCPNDANFFYEIEPVTIEYTNLVWNGKLEPADQGVLKVEKQHQIANFADWCNECGNCDTFCPEYGGPFIQKPSFFANRESWLDNPNRDGFYLTPTGIVGRMEGRVVSLAGSVYSDRVLEATFDPVTHEIISAKPLTGDATGHKLDLKTYHTLRLLNTGLRNPSRVHQVNVPFV
jgi:putative selenate reductase